MKQSTNRSLLYGVVGGYLIYMAYELLKNLIDNVATTMPRVLQILAIIFFTGAGGALLVYAFIIWKKGREDHDENPVDITEKKDGATGEEDDAIK